MAKKIFIATPLALLLALGPAVSHALVIGFEGLISGENTASFEELGINNTYQGFQWTAMTTSEDFPPQWAAAEIGPFGGVSPFNGSGYAWTYFGGQSMFVTFGGGTRTVAGGYFAGQFGSYSFSASTLQMFGYDDVDNLIAQSEVLNLVDGRWQFLAGGQLATTQVHKLELRSNSGTTWFAIDDLEVSDSVVPEPTTLFLLCLGLTALGLVKRRVSRPSLYKHRSAGRAAVDEQAVVAAQDELR